MKKQILRKAFKSKQMIGIRPSFINWDESIIGYIESIEKDSISIKEIDEFGFCIGQTIIKIEDIISIEINDRYQKRLEFICINNSKINSVLKTSIWKNGLEIVNHFDTLIKDKAITTFFFDEENYITGLLLNYDKEYIEVMNVGEEGGFDGYSYYPIFKIIGLRYNSLNEQKIKLLYENRNVFYK